MGFGSSKSIFEFVACWKAPDTSIGNHGGSYLTFFSSGGLVFGIVNLVGNFGTVFCDQAYWQSSVAAKPLQGVWGFIAGGLCWFAIPFGLATTMGLAYLGLSSAQGAPLLSDEDVMKGLAAPLVAQKLLGPVGEYSMLFLILMAVMSTGSAEIIAVASIVIYDVYQTYICPFRRDHKDGQCILCGRYLRQQKGEDVTEVCSCPSAEGCEACNEDTVARAQTLNVVKPHYTCQAHGAYKEYQEHLLNYKNWCIVVCTFLSIPLEGRSSEHFFLQEQVTEFLGVKSFKRKYPDCPRRTINMEERNFLIEMKIVNETQADLGLTAIPSSSVLDIMCQDFYERYELYLTVVNERKERSLRNYNYSSGGGNVKVEEAAKAAAEYNKRLNQERKTQRTAYFDMQTFSVQYPKTGKGRMKSLARPPPGNYPVAMIPGQFVDSYRSYNSKELKFFPLNSVTSAPPKGGLTTRDLHLGSDGSESDSGSSSSGSSSDSDSDSDSESDNDTKQQKAKVKNKQKSEKEEKKKEVKNDVVKDEVKQEEKPRKKVDEVRPNAVCKHCQGNINQNKI